MEYFPWKLFPKGKLHQNNIFTWQSFPQKYKIHYNVDWEYIALCVSLCVVCVCVLVCLWVLKIFYSKNLYYIYNLLVFLKKEFLLQENNII